MQIESRSQWLEGLMQEHGGHKAEWHNMNQTLRTFGYKVTIHAQDKVANLVKSVWLWNRANVAEKPIVVTAVAGWDAAEAEALEEVDDAYESSSCCGKAALEKRVEGIYHDSFSLTATATTGEQERAAADIVVRFPPEYQKKHMELFDRDGKTYLRMPAGLRMRDAEQFLSQHQCAFPATQPTIQYISGVGALTGTGSYGPTRDNPPLSTYVVELTVVDPKGAIRVLSEEKDGEIFRRVRDCHLGAGFIVLDMVVGGIEPAFKLKRVDHVYRFSQVQKAILANNPFNESHFIGHYIPLPGRFARCFRTTTFERTEERKTPQVVPHNLTTLLSYIQTNAAEGIIEYITNTPELQHLFKLVLEAAVAKTFGEKTKVVQVGDAAETWHLLGTYTDLPFVDNNFLITINSPEHGQHVLLNLINWIHETLQQEFRDDRIVPVLTVYIRHTKGIYYPEGEGGIAPTAVSERGQSILSIEPLTYTGLAKTKEYQTFLSGLKARMKELDLSVKEHPGKTLTMERLADSFSDESSKKRLENYREALIALHGGAVEGIERSPFLTPAKRDYIFGEQRGGEPSEPLHSVPTTSRAAHDPALHRKALQYIVELATTHGHSDVRKVAGKLLAGL
ncbi:MAG: FAD-binding protein [Verrucomicrobia bacterium]|nr:FAD-binding protein [Verrucomicrobiota bacterium]MBS0637288.1 FAD-binding protein [Verrucomicrobiota bacterium]